jgi:hypothetical protein
MVPGSICVGHCEEKFAQLHLGPENLCPRLGYRLDLAIGFGVDVRSPRRGARAEPKASTHKAVLVEVAMNRLGVLCDHPP